MVPKSTAQIIGMIGVIATAGATILRELIQLGQAGPAYFKSLMNIMELGTWDSIQLIFYRLINQVC